MLHCTMLDKHTLAYWPSCVSIEENEVLRIRSQNPWVPQPACGQLLSERVDLSPDEYFYNIWISLKLARR
jgi:hypothetical protein